MTLAERLLAVDAALAAGRTPHAFGGAIALAYWTQEPRGTRDLDVNVFLPVSAARGVLGALGTLGIAHDVDDLAAVTRDGQVRLWWDDTPVDLFFDSVPLHADAARDVRRVPFAGAEIPVLGPVQLAAFKAMFDRTKDWADIEAMLVAATLDLGEVERSLRPMLAADDHRWARLAEAQRRADDQRPG